MTRHLRRSSALCLLILSATACGTSETAVSNVSTIPSRNEPVYRKNPSPRHAHPLTATLSGTDGLDVSLDGSIQYDVTNRECVPMWPVVGVSRDWHASLPVSFDRHPDATFSARVYSDGMLDADYHGLGTCHWRIAAVFVDLDVTDKRTGKSFSVIATLPGELISKQRAVTQHFWRDGQARANAKNPDELEAQGPREYMTELRDQVFSLTLAPAASEG